MQIAVPVKPAFHAARLRPRLLKNNDLQNTERRYHEKTLIATALLSLTFAVPAFAAEDVQTPDTESQAAVLFEQGSEFLQSNKYEEAKKGFYRGDCAEPKLY